jgi:hypothetical protein
MDDQFGTHTLLFTATPAIRGLCGIVSRLLMGESPCSVKSYNQRTLWISFRARFRPECLSGHYELGLDIDRRHRLPATFVELSRAI